MNHRRIRAILWAAVPGFCLGGCSLVKLKDDSSAFYSSTVLAGYVTSAVPWDKPVVVAAYARHGSDGLPDIVHHALLHEAGGYELIVPKGDYTVFAFGDANGNLALDVGEPFGVYTTVPVRAGGAGALINLDFAISNPAPQQARAVPLGTSVAGRAAGRPPHSTQGGAIASLDAPMFSAESGRRGYWAPVEFFKEVGGNIYFLDEYDPAKTPILFVHGAAGSPQEWRYFVEHLDRNRYQPWIFYYPSGASLDSMSYLLYWKLGNLQRRYHFNRLYLTAHSMGGLVARSFLATYGDQFPSIKLFVSLSSPWGGDAAADQGVVYSPAVIPSWRDVRAGGRFVHKLFDKPLPRDLDYYLFFGHGGRYSPLRRASSDGVITLDSQLRPAAQAEARRVFGYGADHVGILSSPAAFAQYAALLAEADRKGGRSGALGEGRLRLDFSYAPGSAATAAQPVLVLTPERAGGEPIVVPISALDSGRELGPFPAGAYRAGLVARAFRSTPASVPVTIGAGAAADLAFVLAPQGTLSGYIGADVTSADNPAGSFREGRRDIAIESIVLTDGTDRREIRPAGDTRDRSFDAYLAGQDYAFGSFFSFVGLNEGNYELTIKVSGFQPYRQTYSVAPGKYGYLAPIDLEPLR